jgi:hypothetical protein
VQVIDLESAVFKVFPNPTQGEVVVALPSNAPSKIQVYSLQGSLVYETSHNEQQFAINLSQLPNGVYLIQCEQDGKRFFRKVVKE